MKKLLTWMKRASQPPRKGVPKAPTPDAHVFALRNVRKTLKAIEPVPPQPDPPAAAPKEQAAPKNRAKAAAPKKDLKVAVPSPKVAAPSPKDSKDLLAQLRAAFEKGEWQQTQAIYEKMQGLLKRSQNLRVEATCLAARAQTARKDRGAARALLKQISGEEYPKAVHYDFLAHAFLGLRNYQEAVRCCERAQMMVAAKPAK